jgi:hypothetical protein
VNGQILWVGEEKTGCCFVAFTGTDGLKEQQVGSNLVLHHNIAKNQAHLTRYQAHLKLVWIKICVPQGVSGSFCRQQILDHFATHKSTSTRLSSLFLPLFYRYTAGWDGHCYLEYFDTPIYYSYASRDRYFAGHCQKCRAYSSTSVCQIWVFDTSTLLLTSDLNVDINDIVQLWLVVEI